MEKLNYILSYFPEEIANPLNILDSSLKKRISEIRIRKNNPIIVVIRNTSYFIDYNGDIYDYDYHSIVKCSSECFDKLFMNICDYTIYANMYTMKNGYITLPNGSRVGIGSTAVIDKNGISSVKNISSLNFRISREFVGCSDDIINSLYSDNIPNIIIAGKPNSGKTTFLRDLARGLSNGQIGKYKKVAVVDERNEIAGKNDDDITLDVGINTDVLTGFSKSRGIEIAIRTLSPEIIVCDEISTFEELESIMFGFSSGVRFALSVHIGSKEDLVNKRIVRELINTNEFDYVVLLEEFTYKPVIIERAELQNEINRSYNNHYFLNNHRITII